ncbi:hypothetical protein I552_6748 [Mycobacterium xenopi 3993]|nr:hypothetical protein I552_6748 [Mycobacterium xenopi 3993]
MDALRLDEYRATPHHKVREEVDELIAPCTPEAAIDEAAIDEAAASVEAQPVPPRVTQRPSGREDVVSLAAVLLPSWSSRRFPKGTPQ